MLVIGGDGGSVTGSPPIGGWCKIRSGAVGASAGRPAGVARRYGSAIPDGASAGRPYVSRVGSRARLAAWSRYKLLLIVYPITPNLLLACLPGSVRLRMPPSFMCRYESGECTDGCIGRSCYADTSSDRPPALRRATEEEHGASNQHLSARSPGDPGLAAGAAGAAGPRLGASAPFRAAGSGRARAGDGAALAGGAGRPGDSGGEPRQSPGYSRVVARPAGNVAGAGSSGGSRRLFCPRLVAGRGGRAAVQHVPGVAHRRPADADKLRRNCWPGAGRCSSIRKGRAP